MALTVSILSNDYRTGTRLLDKISTPLSILVGTVDFDSSYPTGGESLDLSDYFGGNHPDLVIFESKSGYVFEYDYTNHKVKAYYGDYDAASDGALTEVADATDLSSVAGVRFIAIGYTKV